MGKNFVDISLKKTVRTRERGFDRLPFNSIRYSINIDPNPLYAASRYEAAVNALRLASVEYKAQSSFDAFVNRLTHTMTYYSIEIPIFSVAYNRVRQFSTSFAGTSKFMANPIKTFTDAINGEIREFESGAYVTFTDGTTVTLNEHDIESWSLLEELKADTDNPIGDVSANEFVLTLNNVERKWSPGNKKGPYYGKLVPNVRIRPWIKVVLEGDISVEFQLGTFYSGDWEAFSDEVVADVVCYDRLYTLINRPFKGSGRMENTTVGALFEKLLVEAAVKNYNIDSRLYNIPVKMGFIEEGTYGDALSQLAEASGAYVRVDRDDVIQIHLADYTQHYQAILDEYDQIISSNIPTRFLETYASISMPIHAPYIGAEEELVTLEVPLRSGSTTIRGIDVSSDNLYNVTEILSGNELVQATVQHRGPYIDLYMKTRAGNSPLVIKGRPVEYAIIDFRKDFPGLEKYVGDKTLEIENTLIQDEAHANRYADHLGKIVANPSAVTDLDIRGNPAIQLGGIVEIVDEKKFVSRRRVLVTRLTLDYNKSLQGTLEGYEV